MAIVVEGTGLQKVYHRGRRNEVHAVNGIDISVERGEFVAIMGPSGSGKSTLLHLLGGLDQPDAGEVRIDGVTHASLSRGQLAGLRARKVGFVFQQFHLIPTLTALENVMLAGRYAGMPWRKQRGRARELLEQFGLGQRTSHKPSELSGGEAQRVALARALMNSPAIILADEPTGELDSATTREIINLLLGLNRGGQSLVVVTHNPVVGEAAHRVLHVVDGRISDPPPGGF
ncbi:MAG: ABC transporter ATP-binding protein [Actinomycetota bacterium]